MPLTTHLHAILAGLLMAGGLVWWHRRRERDIPDFLPRKEAKPKPEPEHPNYGWMP